MSSSCARISARSTPRRRCVGYTPTTLIPAVGSSPPGTVTSKVKAAAPPTIAPSDHAACMRSSVIRSRKRCMRSSVGVMPKYWPIASTADVNSSRSLTVRTSNAIRNPPGNTARAPF
jgi:hypothetical protein